MQRGQVAPIYKRIQNKSNNMWSCKVITYKNEYAGGMLISFFHIVYKKNNCAAC